MKLTVNDLRRAGLKVRIEHFRNFETHLSILGGCKGNRNVNTKEVVKYASFRDVSLVPQYSLDKKWCFYHKPLLKGGKTVMTVCSPYGVEFQSEAVCHNSDPFKKKTGVAICLQRVVSLMRVVDGQDGFDIPYFLEGDEVGVLPEVGV